MKHRVWIIAIAVLFVTAGLFGQTIWTSDKAHSQVRFTVTHLLISEVSGRFGEFDVTLTQGKKDFSGSGVEATVKTASFSTDNEARDKHVRSDAFLNTEKYPTMTFKSTSFEKTGDKTFKIAGQITIRDVTKPVVFDAKLIGVLNDPKGGSRAGFRATTTINRFDFGVKWDKTLEGGGLIVSKEVDITLDVELVKQAPAGTKDK